MNRAPGQGALLALALAALGCGGGPVRSGCDPACAAGSRCDEVTGLCLPEAGDGGGAADLAPPSCNPPCGGLAPHCSAAKRCVGCLDDKSCPPGSYCKISGPDAASCVPGCKDDGRCGGGKCCAMRCVDVGNDSSNCGACGNKCSGHHTQAICVAGKCQMGKCDSGWGDCNKDPKDGCETNVHVDANHCTGCGMKCNMPNAVNACADGCYAAACKWGFDDCNNDPTDGCETSVLADGLNCGACGKSCAKLPNAKAGCQNGGCTLGACDPGYGDCDGDAKNGCETVLGSDPKNCGACGKACAPLPGCQNGQCSQNANSCVGNPQWMKVSCVTPSWVWSRDKAQAKTVQAANAAKLLTTGCMHGEQINATGLCSLDGKGWVSTKTFTMQGCNASWYHLGGSFTGDCGGHDGDTYRHLALGDNDCWAY